MKNPVASIEVTEIFGIIIRIIFCIINGILRASFFLSGIGRSIFHANHSHCGEEVLGQDYQETIILEKIQTMIN